MTQRSESPGPHLIARTVRGLEWVGADEVAAAGGHEMRMTPREIRFRIDEPGSRLLELRTVDDLFVEAGRTPDPGHTKDVVTPLADRIARLDWHTALATVATVRSGATGAAFDVVASFAGRRNFNRFAVEDAIGARLASVLGARYLSRRPVDPPRPAPATDLTVRVTLDREHAVAALRLAGTPMHRREYKQHTAGGTLHPPLAAALVRIAGFAPGATVADPFCGDGTIAIEALRAGAGCTVAGDLDPERLANTRRNAALADVRPTVVRADAGALPLRSGAVDAVVCNPAWNVTVDAAGTLGGGLAPFWHEARRVLTDTGRVVAVLGGGGGDGAAGPGWAVDTTRIRIAGRVSDVIVLRRPGVEPWSPTLAHWRGRAVSTRVIDEAGLSDAS